MAEQTKPDWLKIKPSSKTDFSRMKKVLREKGLSTVCEESHCPNMSECWHNEGTVTFMVMGDTCTRACSFCAVKTSKEPGDLDLFEPVKIARAVEEMNLDYVVITSVDRDDLPDGGADHFARCIREVKRASPDTIVEVLIPDFQGDREAIKKIVGAGPAVIAHNIESVKRLQVIRDPKANYTQSLFVLRTVKELNPKIYTKSALMMGVGEKKEEVFRAMDDLRAVDCDILTMGQYLKPKNKYYSVKKHVSPKTFKEYELAAKKKGFLYVASGPFVRSSYRAGELFIKNVLKKKENTQNTSLSGESSSA